MSATTTAALRALVLALPVAAGQGPVERQLPSAAVEFAEGFTRIGAIRALGDGRVLVADPRDAVVRLVDLDRHSATPVGRSGGGPGEYKTPGRLLPLGGDTTLLTDWPQQRSIVILPGGVAGDAYLSGSRLATAPAAARLPSATDTRGRLYFPGSAFDPARPEAPHRDSVPLLRYDIRTGRLDSLARILLARRRIVLDRGAGGKITSIDVIQVPFVPHDDWAVLPDGRVVIVRTSPFRLEVVEPDGSAHQGAPLPYRPIPVTAVDRKGRPATADEPTTKPPFDGPSTLAAPDGRVWIRRTTPAADSTARYDVLDLGGRLVARIALPPRTRIAGFGPGAMYVVRRDADDLEYLGRLPLPRM